MKFTFDMFFFFMNCFNMFLHIPFLTTVVTNLMFEWFPLLMNQFSMSEFNNFTFAWFFLLSVLILFPMNHNEMYLVSRSSRSQKRSSHCTPASPALTKTSSVDLIHLTNCGQNLFEAKSIFFFGFSIFVIEYHSHALM